MTSALLTIKSLIQQADTYVSSDVWTCIKVEKPSCYLIHDPDLAREILKDETLLPRPVVDFWKRINRLDEKSLPYLTQYFHLTPLLLSGEAHGIARSALRPIYQSIEQNLEATIEIANPIFFSQWAEQKKINVIEFISKYIDFINRSIIAKELAIEADDMPRFDGYQVFEFMPNAKSLQSYDQKLGNLIEFIQSRLVILERPINDSWPLASVTVMAQGPLAGAIAYGFTHNPVDSAVWSGETLAYYAAPVSVFPRIVQQDLTFGDLHLMPGDLLVMSPIISNLFSLRQLGHPGRSMSFGHGAHICTGRKISTKILDLFFRDIDAYTFDFDLKALSLKRSIMLMPVQM